MRIDGDDKSPSIMSIKFNRKVIGKVGNFMNLLKLFEQIPYTCYSGDVQVEINHLVYDSRKVEKNDIFVCISGGRKDGHDFVPDVIEKGAIAIVAERKVRVPDFVTLIVVKDTREALAYLSAAYFDYPAKKLTTIGVTGTKGKSTTVYMIHSILSHAGLKTGLIGTIETIIGDKKIPADNTTPESYLVQQYFADMVTAGCTHVVMEVSSQGLMLKRVAGFVFHYGLFTNLEPDHIGPLEHKDFADYLYCKSLLFQNCEVGIFNCDDEHFEEIKKGHTCTVETFGTRKEATIRATNIDLYQEPGVLSIRYEVSNVLSSPVQVNIPGMFSIYNSLAAIAVCRHFQISEEGMLLALSKVTVKGRVEPIRISDSFTLMIDYAHNAMSLKSLLTTLREYHPNRLVCMFGCGGNRSRDRRFEMGKISSEFADLTVITSDNPRFEEPETIIADIVEGVKQRKGAYVSIVNRKEAIRHCILTAQDGDIIVLAGKGHEDYQEINGVKYPLDERVLIAEIMQEITTLRMKEIQGAIGGVLFEKEEVLISDYSTNSKVGSANTLFVPVIGENKDAHDFILDAYQNGIRAAFSSRSKIEPGTENMTYLMVDHAVDALQKLAKWYRRLFCFPIIAVTGSVGKTTTKEMMAVALKNSGRILKTEGNRNSQVGLPAMIMRLSGAYDFAVLEMGMSLQGEMSRLADIVKPDVAIITNIGLSHIGQLGSMEKIRKEKLCIINQMKAGSCLLLNGDDPLLYEVVIRPEELDLYEETKEKLKQMKIECFGTLSHCQYQAKQVRVTARGTEFLYLKQGESVSYPVVLKAPGRHQVLNALATLAIATLAIAKVCKIEMEDVIGGLLSYEPSSMRGQIEVHRGITLINDTYNASPDSVRSALSILSDLQANRKIVVLADNLELGAYSKQSHYELGCELAKLPFDLIVLIGKEVIYTKEGLLDTTKDANVQHFLTNQEAALFLKQELLSGDAVLVKGSRGMKLEEVIEEIR